MAMLHIFTETISFKFMSIVRFSLEGMPLMLTSGKPTLYKSGNRKQEGDLLFNTFVMFLFYTIKLKMTVHSL